MLRLAQNEFGSVRLGFQANNLGFGFDFGYNRTDVGFERFG